jgi:hypothetical protein
MGKPKIPKFSKEKEKKPSKKQFEPTTFEDFMEGISGFNMISAEAFALTNPG